MIGVEGRTALDSPFDLTAEFRSRAELDRARQARSEAGLANDQMILSGGQASAGEADALQAAEEQAVVRSMARWIVTGAAIGAALGAVTGLLAWLAIADGELRLYLAAGLSVGLVAGGMIGGLEASGAHVRLPATHRGHPGGACWSLSVRAGTADVRAHVERVLRANGALRINDRRAGKRRTE